MIKTIVVEIGIQPSEIKKMYVDDFDFLGIIYWYNEAERIIKLKNKQ
jgi:hypothetical protein